MQNEIQNEVFTDLYELLSINHLLLSVTSMKNNVSFYNRWPGRAHDAQVWHMSPLCKDLHELCLFDNQRIDETFHIIGDSAYPMSNHLMVPFRTRGRKLTDIEKKFNTHLASKRSVIERAFGLLGLHFPRITHLKCKSNEKRIICVVAACLLHNWCLMEDDDDESLFEMLDSELEMDVNDDVTAETILGTRRANAGGVTKRLLLCDYIRNAN